MIIGIDLGTTNSLAAYFTEDGPKIIPNRLGKNLTPSVVSVDENDQIFVGETAKERVFSIQIRARKCLKGIWEAIKNIN